MRINYSECNPWDIKHLRKVSTTTCFYYTRKKSKPFIKRGGLTSDLSLGVLGPVSRWFKVYNRHRELRNSCLRLSSQQLKKSFLEDLEDEIL